MSIEVQTGSYQEFINQHPEVPPEEQLARYSAALLSARIALAQELDIRPDQLHSLPASN